MKKLLYACIFLLLATPAHLCAQYSNANLNGPWLLIGVEDNGGNLYILFNGSGVVEALGEAGDSLHPAGTYTVQSSGLVTATITEAATNIIYISGDMINDSLAGFYADTTQGPFEMIEVTNPGFLAGTWTGTITDTGNQTMRNVQLTVNSAGSIMAATGVPLDSGKIFAARDTFAGLIVTSDTGCAFTYIEVSGIYRNDTLAGLCKLGPKNANGCGSSGTVLLTRTTTGILPLNQFGGFSVYPNPFSSSLQISVQSPSANTEAGLYDMLGRKLISQEWSNQKNIAINTNMLSAGVYLLTLTTGGKTTTCRVVKD